MKYLVDLYSKLYAYNFIYSSKYNPKRVVCNVLSKAIRKRFLTYIQKKESLNIQPLSLKDEVVVSLTSFPKRMSYLKYTLMSIFLQTKLPDKIVVNLIKSECPNGLADIPNDLLWFQKYGVEFIFREENLKPHNKYYYTFEDNPNSIIITIDDDLWYKSDLIEKLLDLHEKNPKAVCANLVRKIKMKDGEYSSYNNWSIYNENVIGDEYVAMGFGGVLYPSSLFANTELLNEDLIKELSLNTDDLWLKAIEIVSGIPVVTGSFNGFPLSLETATTNALSDENVGCCRNDRNWGNLERHFRMSEKLATESK